LKRTHWGCFFFKNAGFDVKEALTTLQVLDGITGKIAYDLDIPKITHVAHVEYKKNDLLKNADKGNDSWLDLDSMKSHPDCSRRFDLMAQNLGLADDFSTFSTDFNASNSFVEFKREITYFNIECYLQYDRLDLALLTLWKHLEDGDENIYVKKKNFQALADVVYARKKHKTGLVFTFPNDSMSAPHYALSSMIFGMRFKDFVDAFSTLAMESYDESFVDEESMFALIKIAYSKGDREELSYYKSEYFSKFDLRTGKHYRTIKYLH
jgi:hypothetical protein